MMQNGNYCGAIECIDNVLNKIPQGMEFAKILVKSKTILPQLKLGNYGELIKDLDREYALEPEIISHKEYTKKELMEQELDIFGLYLTDNPITELKSRHTNISNLNDVESLFDKNINIIVNIDKIKEIDTKNSDKMAFLNISDELKTIDAVLFPKTYEKYNWIKKDDIVLIVGHVEKRFDKYQIIVNEIVKL